MSRQRLRPRVHGPRDEDEAGALCDVSLQAPPQESGPKTCDCPNLGGMAVLKLGDWSGILGSLLEHESMGPIRLGLNPGATGQIATRPSAEQFGGCF